MSTILFSLLSKREFMLLHNLWELCELKETKKGQNQISYDWGAKNTGSYIYHNASQ